MMAQADPRRGVNAIAAFNKIWKEVREEIQVPEGYTMKYFGEQESQAESNAALAANMPLTFFPDVHYPVIPVQNLPQANCHPIDVAAYLYWHRTGINLAW